VGRAGRASRAELLVAERPDLPLDAPAQRAQQEADLDMHFERTRLHGDAAGCPGSVEPQVVARQA